MNRVIFALLEPTVTQQIKLLKSLYTQRKTPQRTGLKIDIKRHIALDIFAHHWVVKLPLNAFFMTETEKEMHP